MRNHYLQQSVNTASPARLVTMLYDRLLLAIDRTTNALDSVEASAADMSVAHDELVRAQRIVHELRVSLDLEQGGEIAANLSSLYEWSHEQLVLVNTSKDPRALAGVRKVIDELRTAWRDGVELAQAPA